MTGLRLRKLEAEVCEPVEETVAELSANLQGDAEAVSQLDEFDLRFQLEVKCMNAGDESFNLSVLLEGHFEAVVDPKTIDQQVVRQFITRDAALMLWPYLREAVQSITARMGFMMPPLPILDARDLLDTSAPQEQETSDNT